MKTAPLRLPLSLLTIFCVFCLPMSGSVTHAAELLMFERAGCVYCARWNTDIAPAYIASKEAKIAPLRRHDLARGQPANIRLVAPVRFTPTFVLVDKGVELGRITGYFDNAMFWGMLDKLVQPLKQ